MGVTRCEIYDCCINCKHRSLIRADDAYTPIECIWYCYEKKAWISKLEKAKGICEYYSGVMII